MQAILITGTSTGIGRATVELLLEKGFFVFATHRNHQHEPQSPGERLFPTIMDVTDRASVLAAADAVKHVLQAKGIQLRAIVNNAGISIPGPLESLSDESLRAQFETNVFGVIRVTTAFLPLLREYSKTTGLWSRVINVGSIAGIVAHPYLGTYCASKAAVESITESIRMELLPMGIHATTILPGSIRTPIWEATRKRARDLQRGWNSDLAALYAVGLSRVLEASQKLESSGSDPRVVASAVYRAVKSIRPCRRYLVGKRCRIVELLKRVLPSPMFEKLVLHDLGLTGLTMAKAD